MPNLSWCSILAGLLAGASVGEAQVSRREVLLRESLIRYQRIAAGNEWPVIGGGPRLEPSVRSPRVIQLRARLQSEGYRTSGAEDPGEFDGLLEQTVRRFQATHGIAEDGIVGPATLGALNVSAHARARQIEANLDPRRAPSASLTDRYLVVNIAAYSLDLVEGDTSRLHLRAVVGRRDWPTPTLSARITDVVFAPLWRVPLSIATREILPTARRDPDYFERNKIRIFRDSAGRTLSVDPSTVDWSTIPAARFPYRFVADAGPTNPLGRVKLVLQTPYDIYLHDTPLSRLFDQDRRALSHGCVRVEHIVALLTQLLPDWPIDSIEAAMAGSSERRLPLATPVPVHLVYWTAWPGPDGLVAFREDIYRLDARGKGGHR